MIQIIHDPGNLVKPGKAACLESLAQYPAYVSEIMASFQAREDYSLLVRHSAALQWLKNMSQRYPQGSFVFETVDARGTLAQNWGMEIPANVTNEDILQAGLLALDVQPQPGLSFEDALLAYFYDRVLAARTFPFTQVTTLLDAFDALRWEENHRVHLLARTLHARLEAWKNKARSSEQRQLVELYAADPQGLKRDLMQYRILRHYPAVGEALLGDVYFLFKALKLQLEDLAVEVEYIPQSVLQVTYALNSQDPQDAQEVSALLEGMSGLLAVEFDKIEELLRRHPDWNSPELIDSMEAKFVKLPRGYARRIADLRNLIMPAKPAVPEKDWDAAQMLAWATESYLPYQAWCNAQEQFDPDLFQTGDLFSEWLMDNWADLHANSKRMVFNILPGKAPELKQPDVVNLVLVVDNLGWSFSEMLSQQFQEKGYYLGLAEPYLAMAPSETEISKKCLLSGSVGYQDIDDRSYRGIIEKGWVPFFDDHAFRYLSDIGSLGLIETIEAGTYVVNYLAVDKALHKSADEIGMPHRDHIQHLLEKLVENCEKFIDKHGLQERIRIHVVSDHGSTRIPKEIRNDLDPSFFKSNGFETLSHRFTAVSNERFAGLADNLKMDCFFLPANDFRNPQNYLCARRGNRFLPTDRDVYVHGGLLPEEMIVPYMRFEPAIADVQDLTLLLKKNDFRYRMEMVEIELGNPNDSAVDQIQVSILNGNVESEPASVARLNGKTKTSLEFPARFKLTSLADEQKQLRIRVRFRARGQQQVFDEVLDITLKKMVEEKSSGIFDM